MDTAFSKITDMFLSLMDQLFGILVTLPGEEVVLPLYSKKEKEKLRGRR